MSKISEKVAFLDGLMEGLDIQDEKLKKVFNAIIDTLDEIAEEVSDQQDAIDEMDETLDDVCDCLDEHDEILFGDDYDEDDEDYDEDEDVYCEAECPHCGKVVTFDPEIPEAVDDDGMIICPECGKKFDPSAEE